MPNIDSMSSDWRGNATGRSLENWERWIKIRKEGEQALSNATGRPPGCLLMSKDSVWQLRRQKEIILDAQKIKEYQCKCGKSGCPLFWKTTLPLRPCGKSLLAEAYFAPLKLTHENGRLSHIIEAEYIGLPECLSYRDEPLAAKCFETSLDRWNKLPYVVQKRSELKKQINEVQGFIPQVNDLVIVGSSLEKPKKVEVKHCIPEIIIEEVFVEPIDLDESKPILQLGSFILRGCDKKGVVCEVDFAPVLVPQTHARDILIANRGAIAIEYSWTKLDHIKTDLPLCYTKKVLSRFFFNKCDGILLPGQSFEQRFFFKPRTSGLYREVWSLDTTPKLCKIKFILEGVASKNPTQENDHMLFIDNYMSMCMKKTLANEIAQSILHQTVTSREENTNVYSSKFLEKEMFNYINPTLHYDMDTIREVKELYSRYFKEKWNLSMCDLCDMLLETLKAEEESTKLEVMNTFIKLYRKLQKKSPVTEIDQNDWEMLKYDLCYMLLCTAIGQMEKCLRYENWGIPKPSRPLGPKGEYSGDIFEITNKEKYDELINYIKKGQIEDSKIDETNSTEDEEDKILEDETRMKEMNTALPLDDDDIEEFTFNIGRRIEFEGPEEITLPSRRWPDRFNIKNTPSQEIVVKKDAKPLKDPKKIEKNSIVKAREVKGAKFDDHSSSMISKRMNLAYEDDQSETKPEILNFHRAFEIMHWRNILERTIDNITEVVDLLNTYRGDTETIEPRLTERLHHSCYKHSVIAED